MTTGKVEHAYWKIDSFINKWFKTSFDYRKYLPTAGNVAHCIFSNRKPFSGEKFLYPILEDYDTLFTNFKENYFINI